MVQFAQKVDAANAINITESAILGQTELINKIKDIHYKGQNGHCANLENSVGKGNFFEE